MRIALLLAALTASLSVAACTTTHEIITKGDGGAPATGGDTSTTVPAVTDAASFCAAMCGRVQACDKALDTQTCENQCENGSAAVFPRLRSDVVELIVECFDGKDCKTVLGGGFVGACTADAVATVAPSSAATSFCEALASAKKGCSGAAPQTKAECLNTAKLYSDAAIAEALNCAKRGCTEIDSCVSAVFGSLGGSTAGKPATGGSCSDAFADLGACASCAETSCCAEGAACYGDAQCHAIVRACLISGSGSSACQQAYTSASSSTQSLASTFFTCGQSKCSSACTLGGGGNP